MRSNAAYATVLQLVSEGLNDCQIARSTGVPRCTVRDWRNGRTRQRPLSASEVCAKCGHPVHDFECLPQPSYAYLLGMYLGDGHMSRGRTDKIYVYPRYNFTSASDDIRALFTNGCDQLGIEWRQMNARNISVARRASVARLDEFVGPKY